MDQFGYLVLFAALVLELLALPLPGEVLMTYAGLLIFQGKLSWPLCILAAGAGASAGMTASYFIGSKLGSPFFEKHGAKIHFGPDKLLEIVFTLVVLFGGELLDEGLRRLFRRVGPGNLPDTFPSEQTLITVIFLGFAAYLLSRQATKTWIRLLAALLVIAASLLVGISRVYFKIQYPSDVVAGYVFGGVCLSLNITVLEIFRITRGKVLNGTEAF